MKICSTQIIFLIVQVIYTNAAGHDSIAMNAPLIEPLLSYTCDGARNFCGGIKTGNAYMGMLITGFTIHTDKRWKGGSFSFQLMNTHGYNLSENYIGDLQVVSNIENGNYTFIGQLIYTQRFRKGFITLGVHNLNNEFVTSEFSAGLTNSSFGIFSIFPLNFPVSIYPKTALAALISYQINDHLRIKTGLYDGDAGSLEEDPHNLNWSIQDFLSINELEINTNQALNTTLKLGGYYHSGEFVNYRDSLQVFDGNYGFYLITDQQLTDRDIRNVGLFGQLGITPSDRNFNTWYAGFGANVLAPLKKRPDDVLAIGVAYGAFYNSQYECDIECNYYFSINNYLAIQPTIHYIINPGAGVRQELKDATAGFIRISIGI
jgi:porin